MRNTAVSIPRGGAYPSMPIKTKSYDIEKWIEKTDDSAVQELRKAVHTVITAISNSSKLREKMIIKGGVLLAIRYEGIRLTKDIDFSTSEKYNKSKTGEILEELKESLAKAIEELDYGLDCKIQSYEVMPARVNPTFPTLKIKLGYAYKGTSKHARLLAGKCPDTLEIHYSFNEINLRVDTLRLRKHRSLKTYSTADLVAEKYRAILQQKTRNRYRRQDAYDIYSLIINGHLEKQQLKPQILESLKRKSALRGMAISKDSLSDPEVIRRSRADYDKIAQEIEGAVPPFEQLFGSVKDFYESLPWNTH